MDETNVVIWNLPPWLVCQPGALLTIIAILSNPDAGARRYAVKLRVWQNGQLVSEESLTIDGLESLEIEGGETLLVYTNLTATAADVMLELVVIDADTTEYLGSVTCNFLSAVPAARQINEWIPAIGAVLITGAAFQQIGGA